MIIYDSQSDIKQMGVNPLKDGAVKLPKIGWVKLRQSRAIPDGFELRQARVVRRASGCYVMLVLGLDAGVPDILPHGEPLGIDLGLEKFLATSTGLLMARPKFFVSLQSKLKTLQKKMRNKRVGSSNWRKACKKVARANEQISNTRKDLHYKVANQLIGQVRIGVMKININVELKGVED